MESYNWLPSKREIFPDEAEAQYSSTDQRRSFKQTSSEATFSPYPSLTERPDIRLAVPSIPSIQVVNEQFYSPVDSPSQQPLSRTNSKNSYLPTSYVTTGLQPTNSTSGRTLAPHTRSRKSSDVQDRRSGGTLPIQIRRRSPARQSPSGYAASIASSLQSQTTWGSPGHQALIWPASTVYSRFLMPDSRAEDEDEAWNLAIDFDISGITLKDISELNPIFQDTLHQAAQQHRVPSPPAFESLAGHDTDERSINENIVEDFCCDESKKTTNISRALWYCYACKDLFCDSCWSNERAHKKKTPGHDKVPPKVARIIEDTLDATINDDEQAQLHVLDSQTTWFGAGIDDEGTPVFRDFDRYANLMTERLVAERPRSAHRGTQKCYPGLISFVGETGAGKSSLIKMLIGINSGEASNQTPVVGSSKHAETPTSGDVHLFRDPASFLGARPILYADCEGLNGGTRDPMGAKYRHRRGSMVDESRPRTPSKSRTPSLQKHLRKKYDPSAREIVWADSAETSTRAYYVKHLYPRLLYTFSDVIVFVVKNARAIEDVIEQLIVWADAVIESSSNQPVLPHAIIVLNASENKDPKLWNMFDSTTTLLHCVSDAVNRNPVLQRHAETWRTRHKRIDSVESLLLSYYSSIKVIRIPERRQLGLVHQQIQQLYEEITESASMSHESKHHLRMKLNSDELQPYLQSAFDHFCQSLQRPFDFVEASFANSKIPSDFSGNILKLTVNVMDHYTPPLDPCLLFKELSYMVASCVMLDAVRHRNLGTAEMIFPAYLEHFDEVLDDFCNLVWPCEYVSPRGRCVNVRAGHRKGHQMKGGQIVVAEGEYEANFEANAYRARFRNDIYNNLAGLLQLLRSIEKDTGCSEIEAALKIHKDKVLQHFYKHLGGAEHFTSHSACLSCLVGPAQHCLPCGHILCIACVQGYGESRGHASMITDMNWCPLHEQESKFERPWPISLRPANAGVRILSLDGGGIRGIVELAVLRKVEEALGNRLRIQTFFDLIVGTSTGGIIALGLGEKLWSVKICTQKFEALARKAFTRQRAFGIEFVDFIIAAANHGRYKTGPLEETLRMEFGDGPLFGGPREAPDIQVVSWGRPRVAVLTTTTNGKPYVLANYNRTKVDDSGPYDFLRAERPDRELKTWEAARATSAALRIFKPYSHTSTGNVFMDGGIYYNNPVEVAVRESKLLWPDCKSNHPDLVLSIGTSFTDRARKKNSASVPHETGIVGYFKQLVKTAVDHVKSSLDSEQKWRSFTESINSQPRANPNANWNRFKRVNFETAESPPRPDDFSKMQQLRDVVDAMLAVRMDEINDIADRLIATSFFFQPSMDSRRESRESLTSILGTISCRFPPHSYEIQRIGELFRDRCKQQYLTRCDEAHPCFVIEEKWKEADAVQVIVTDEIIKVMITEASKSRLLVSLTTLSCRTLRLIYTYDLEESLTLPSTIPSVDFLVVGMNLAHNRSEPV